MVAVQVISCDTISILTLPTARSSVFIPGRDPLGAERLYTHGMQALMKNVQPPRRLRGASSQPYGGQVMERQSLETRSLNGYSATATSRNAAATYSSWLWSSSAYIGSDRILPAMVSVMLRSPAIRPTPRAAPC